MKYKCVSYTSWRGKRQPTPVFSPGNSQDREALWATVHGVAQESDMTEQLNNNKAAHI